MNGVLYRLVQLSYLMLPAYAANMAPPLVKYWRGWNPPSRRVTSGITRPSWASWRVCARAWARPSCSRALAIGLRLGIPPGAPWIPFDQLDFAAGALLLLAPRLPLSILDYGLIVAVSAGGHIAVNHVAYGLGIRDTRW